MNTSYLGNSGRIVYVGLDSYIYTVTADGTGRSQLTWSWQEEGNRIGKDFVQTESRGRRLTFTCPTWSPGGKIACVGYPIEGASLGERAGIYVIDPAAAEIRKIYETTAGETPFYMMWAPDNEKLAFLAQKTTLHLNLGWDPSPPSSSIPFRGKGGEREGAVRSLITGAPCFFAISPDAGHLLVHVGGSYRYSLLSRLTLFDLREVAAEGPHPYKDISLVPASFCAPSWSYDGHYISYAAQGSEGADAIYISDREDKDKQVVTSLRGKSAFLWAPDSLKLAFSAAHTEDPSSLYEGLSIFDVARGTSFRLLEDDLVAFFWSPRGDQIIYILYNPVEECFEWSSVDLLKHEQVQVASFVPSEEMLLLFSFFDQYAGSHPLISPDGQYLVYAGYEDWEHRMNGAAAPRIFVAPLHRDMRPYPVAEGRFASWSLSKGERDKMESERGM